MRTGYQNKNNEYTYNAVGGSPRKLIILCRLISAKHLHRDTVDHWLNTTDLSEAILEFRAQIQREKR